MANRPPAPLKMHTKSRLGAYKTPGLHTSAMHYYVALDHKISMLEWALQYERSEHVRIRIEHQLIEMKSERQDLQRAFASAICATVHPDAEKPKLRPEPNVRSLESEGQTREDEKKP